MLSVLPSQNVKVSFPSLPASPWSMNMCSRYGMNSMLAGGECGDFFFVVKEGELPVLQVTDLVKKFGVFGEQTDMFGNEFSNYRW
ncbi:hypothetical protein ckrop_0312 [Corynebacterium kroppenstedtii DSM 44385]|uniref:Cyclic nucleotide-binding domain-containing protein n=2 Tax=Corynebacterium kroppenstedtii TaxID=161879 RepID=C4LGY9_CORK4|nr:hypothetical protein ckrop_0312 [Corynebacterium kroppenstedtii DSM 44385]